jgi:threonine dehydratase
VLEVSHERLAPSLGVDEAEVVMQVEARGPEHCELVVAELHAAGYAPVFS